METKKQLKSYYNKWNSKNDNDKFISLIVGLFFLLIGLGIFIFLVFLIKIIIIILIIIGVYYGFKSFKTNTQK